MKFLLVFLLSITLFGCPLLENPDPEVDATINIINNSDKDIAVNFKFSYPDTSIVNTNKIIDGSNYLNGLIKTNGSKGFPDSWKLGFKNNPNKVMIFVFAKDTIDKLPWEVIKKEYKILKRYDLDLEQLEAINWTIDYR